LAQEGVSKEQRQIPESDMEKLRKVVETFRETPYRGSVLCSGTRRVWLVPNRHVEKWAAKENEVRR